MEARVTRLERAALDYDPAVTPRMRREWKLNTKEDL